ncbi:MAG: polysaccharide export protein [Acidobacteriia bacterium]|nr:polysaccharide export protein [Terriglobia bacterium]
MKCRRYLIVSLGLILAGGQTLAAQEAKAAAAGGKKAETQKASGAVTQALLSDRDYKIGPQDILRVDVWKEPDITRQVTVRPDGKISLPLLNDVQAAGLTPMELAGVIRDGLKKYITDPQVTVTISDINSRRVYVTGEVQRAGAYPLLPNMTVLQALSSCGGFTQFANTKKIYILRTEDGKQVRIPVNYKDVVSGRKPEKNILLQTGDTIVVP